MTLRPYLVPPPLKPTPLWPGILLAVVIGLLVFAASARGEEVLPDVTYVPPAEPSWFDAIDTPETRFLLAMGAIVLVIELLRWGWPQLRRQKGVVMPAWGKPLILGVGLVIGQVAAFGGLLPRFSSGTVGVVFVGVCVTALAVLFNEAIMAAIRKGLQKVLTKIFGVDAPNVEFTPGPEDFPPAPEA